VDGIGPTLRARESVIQLQENPGLLPRIGNALVSYAMHLWQMLYPVDLAVFYPHPEHQLSGWAVGLAVGILTGMVAGNVPRRAVPQPGGSAAPRAAGV